MSNLIKNLFSNEEELYFIDNNGDIWTAKKEGTHVETIYYKNGVPIVSSNKQTLTDIAPQGENSMWVFKTPDMTAYDKDVMGVLKRIHDYYRR